MRASLLPVLIAAIVCASSPPASAASEPVLAGPWARGQHGYGQRRPATVFNGGDPTGLVEHIEWRSWGGARAVGIGTGIYVGPSQIVAEGTPQATVIVLFKLGSCHGRRAYDAITWYYPQHGERFNARHYIDPCSGAYL